MEIREVKIGELVSFVHSNEFERLSPKPITVLRAVSQFHNPDADPAQTALIYVTDGNNLLGFAGLLPRKINHSGVPVFSNTCWWVHPEKGRGLAVPLILKILEKSASSLYLAESTPQLKAILEKTGPFEYFKTVSGVRGFLRFYTTGIFANRYPKLAKLSFLFVWMDSTLNFLAQPYRFLALKILGNNNLEIETTQTIGPKLESFINEHSSTDFIRKTPDSFYWFRDFPWVGVSGGKTVNYPFTLEVNSYTLEYYTFKFKGEIKAFAAISNRDNLARVPYIYFDKDCMPEVVKAILWIILRKRYDSLLVFQPDLAGFINTHRMPFLFRKKMEKIIGATKPVYRYFLQNPTIQDGDGDVIFT